MPDREKVIKGLEILINGCEYIHCDDCCFYISTKPTRCGLREEQIKDDALALLKEQEAVEPIKPLDKDDGYTFMCSNCKGELFCGDVIRDNFCPTCGRSVKWS